MPIILLGNPAPLERGAVLPGELITLVHVPPSATDDEAFRDITHVPQEGSPESGLWPAHSAAAAPSWVEAPDHPALAARLAEHYGCPVGRPASDAPATPALPPAKPAAPPALLHPPVPTAPGSVVNGV